jgi:hypothetical protein
MKRDGGLAADKSSKKKSGLFLSRDLEEVVAASTPASLGALGLLTSGLAVLYVNRTKRIWKIETRFDVYLRI